MSTIVYTCGGGRLGNQLLTFCHLLAFRLEHPELEIVDLPFIRYAATYGNAELKTNTDPAKVPLARLRMPIRLFWQGRTIATYAHYRPLDQFRLILLHALADRGTNTQSIVGGDPHKPFSLPGQKHERFDLSEEENVERLRQCDVSLLAGWAIRCWPLVAKHADELRQWLQPGEAYMTKARACVDELRKRHDLLVGVLVRQGDYRSWNEGRFFFTSEEYEALLRSFSATREERNVGFLIASDEAQPATLFQDGMFHLATGQATGPGHFLENFAELSLCDIVLSPPSTFSVLPAFLGNVPICPLYSGVKTDGWEYLNDPLLDSIDHPVMKEAIK